MHHPVRGHCGLDRRVRGGSSGAPRQPLNPFPAAVGGLDDGRADDASLSGISPESDEAIPKSEHGGARESAHHDRVQVLQPCC